MVFAEQPAAKTLSSTSTPAMPAITAEVEYGARLANGSHFFYRVGELPEGQERTNVKLEPAEIVIQDMRHSSEPLTWQQQGFQLESLAGPPELEWTDKHQVQAVIYPEVEAAIKRVTAASKVFIFDHTLRKGSVKTSDLDFGARKQAAPSSRPHCDYTAHSGPNRLKQLVADQAEELQRMPYAIIQAWLPRRGPVQDSPLALCDAASVAQEDLQRAVLHFPHRTGETYLVAHNPDHRWYYASQMQTHEMYLWTGYDSRAGKPCFIPHTSFQDPSTPADAPERESIELRAYIFWEDK